MDIAHPSTAEAQRSTAVHGLNGQRDKIRASGVSFYYGRFRALHDVSLAIAENKITAMIGPSGCGKSTLLQIFNRMYDLTPGTRVKGSVKIGQEEITTTVRLHDLRRRVGMVFQRANPFPMPIYDNVAYGPRLMGWSQARVQSAVEESLRFTGSGTTSPIDSTDRHSSSPAASTSGCASRAASRSHPR